MKINLEERLEKEIIKVYSEFKNSKDFSNHDKIIAKNAMKEACKQILELAAKNAKIKTIMTSKGVDLVILPTWTDIVDKQSILDVIKFVE